MAEEARMTFQPGTDVGMLVRAVVVHDEMQGDLSGELFVQSPEEPQELLVPVPLVALSDYAHAQNFHCPEQGRGSVPLVIVRDQRRRQMVNLVQDKVRIPVALVASPATALLQGQTGLCTIQRL